MVIDASAVIAFLVNEPEARRIRMTIVNVSECSMSALNVYQCRITLGRKFMESMLREFELLLLKADITIIPFDEEQAVLAHRAYEAFGKGSGHPAKLTFSDCAAYALAKSLGEPLLFKGEGFSYTDIKPAIIG